MLRATAVVHEDRPGDDRGRRHAVVALDDGVDAVGGEDLQRRALGRCRHRMGVLSHVEGAVDAPAAAEVADGLGDRRDVGLGERAGEGGASMAAGPEADELRRVGRVRCPLVVLAHEAARVHQHLRRGRLAGQRRDHHRVHGHAGHRGRSRSPRTGGRIRFLGLAPRLVIVSSSSVPDRRLAAGPGHRVRFSLRAGWQVPADRRVPRLQGRDPPIVAQHAQRARIE